MRFNFVVREKTMKLYQAIAPWRANWLSPMDVLAFLVAIAFPAAWKRLSARA
jgi:hypothetical protein